MSLPYQTYTLQFGVPGLLEDVLWAATALDLTECLRRGFRSLLGKMRLEPHKHLAANIVVTNLLHQKLRP